MEIALVVYGLSASSPNFSSTFAGSCPNSNDKSSKRETFGVDDPWLNVFWVIKYHHHHHHNLPP